MLQRTFANRERIHVGIWKNIWLECVKTNEPHNSGFDDLEDGDLIDFLDAEQELLDEYLINIQSQSLLQKICLFPTMKIFLHTLPHKYIHLLNICL